MESEEKENENVVQRSVKTEISPFFGKLKVEFRGMCPGGNMSYYYNADLIHRRGPYANVK